MKMTNRHSSLYRRFLSKDGECIKKDEKPSVRASTGVLRYVWRDKESVSETTLAIYLKKQLSIPPEEYP